MNSAAIRVSNLSKKYRIGVREQKSDTLLGRIGNVLKSPLSNFKRLQSMTKFNLDDESVHWALKDINFEVQKGEVLGIIGHNGAGKSTLLKILSRITPPSTGEIEISGRVSSLLEVGTGFHPELTGRDNIYMNGTIHGMRRKEINLKLDEIVSFSGVENYIDTPVKFYSSGMKVRLGFAVAAHLEPEILIIDEVLAVGDVEFQKKCLSKMNDVSKSGRTVLFVSHDMGAIRKICPETIILKSGTILCKDKSENAILQYLENLGVRDQELLIEQNGIAISERKIQGADASGKCLVNSSKPIEIELTLNSNLADFGITFGFDIFNGFGTKLIHIRSDSFSRFILKNGQNKLFAEFNSIPFLSGTYHINAWIAEYKGRRIQEYEDLILFEVLPSDSFSDHQAHLKSALIVPDTKFRIE